MKAEDDDFAVEALEAEGPDELTVRPMLEAELVVGRDVLELEVLALAGDADLAVFDSEVLFPTVLIPVCVTLADTEDCMLVVEDGQGKLIVTLSVTVTDTVAVSVTVVILSCAEIALARPRMKMVRG